MVVVPGTGVEPAPTCADYTLNVACLPISPSGLWDFGGEGGIRTHGTRKGTAVFETARFNHSRTSPLPWNLLKVKNTKLNKNK